jgi:putative spermidine/putrescine transport system substrate-binding protein
MNIAKLTRTGRRKRSLGVAAAALAVLLPVLAACSSSGSSASASGGSSASATPAATGSVTFAAYGGTGEAAEAQAWLDPFAKEAGVKVQQASPVTWAQVQQMVQAHDVTWDVAEGGIQQGVTDNPDLVDIDCKIVDCALFKGNAFPAYKQAVPLFQFDYVLTYNTNDFKGKKAPTSWADFFNPAIKGQRDIMPSSSGWEGLLEGALLASGVPRNKLYPLDMTRALNEIDKIRNQMVVESTDDQCVSDVASGEAIMGTCYNGREALAQEAGQPVAIAWGQQIQFVDYLFIPKGTPNEVNAQKLIAYIVSHEGNIGNYIAYSGINSAGLDPNSKWTKFLPSQNVLTGNLAPIVPNVAYWDANLNADIEKITAWVAG